MSDGNALVSVLIRSTGRPSLVASVESVYRQTHRPIEIVIVHAGEGSLPELPRDESVEVRVVGGRKYTRPQAANVGLRSAGGEWLVFLDDDDAFLPAHVASLLDALRESHGALVAYSSTTCLDAAGRVFASIGMEFDRRRLFAQNYIQIGAALFSMVLVREGYRFDETFECLQDWDFWIQLAQRTHFAHTEQQTIVWSACGGGSGCGMGSNFHAGRFTRFQELIGRKWRASAMALDREVRHHEAMAQEALKKGSQARADAHLETAARLLRGPVPVSSLIASRLAKRRIG